MIKIRAWETCIFLLDVGDDEVKAVETETLHPSGNNDRRPLFSKTTTFKSVLDRFLSILRWGETHSQRDERECEHIIQSWETRKCHEVHERRLLPFCSDLLAKALEDSLITSQGLRVFCLSSRVSQTFTSFPSLLVVGRFISGSVDLERWDKTFVVHFSWGIACYTFAP